MECGPARLFSRASWSARVRIPASRADGRGAGGEALLERSLRHLQAPRRSPARRSVAHSRRPLPVRVLRLSRPCRGRVPDVSRPPPAAPPSSRRLVEGERGEVQHRRQHPPQRLDLLRPEANHLAEECWPRSGRDAEVARTSVPASPLGNSRAAVSSGTLGPSSGTLGLSWALSRLERRHCLLPRLWPVEPVPLLHPPRPRRQRGAVRLCRQHLERLARLTSRARDMSRTCPPEDMSRTCPLLAGPRPSGGASGSQPPANW